MKKFQEFQWSYDKAVKTIHEFLQPNHPMQKLVHWMMETDANPYGYLPEKYAAMTCSAEGFAGLLRSMHHNLYDDGDVTIVKVNGEPRITFVWKREENFRDLVLSESEKQQEAIYSRRYTDKQRYRVEILDINPIDFGDHYDEWYREDIKRWFLNSAEWQGANNAAKHYSKYKFFDHAWIDEWFYGVNENG